MAPRTHRLAPFTPASIGEEISRGRARRRMTVVAVTDAIGMQRTQWYKKIAGAPPFTIREMARLAVVLDAPRGWPLVPWDEGLAWEAYLRGQAQ